MEIDGILLKLPRGIKWFIISFVLTLSIGFYTGLLFVTQTSTTSPAGVEENYLGNEEIENVAVMKFKKSPREMLTIIHTHILSMSLIFLLLGALVWITRLPQGLKLFLTIEPFLSVLLTFGGIYGLWMGIIWLKYIVVFSGILMTVTFLLSSVIVVFQALKKAK